MPANLNLLIMGFLLAIWGHPPACTPMSQELPLDTWGGALKMILYSRACLIWDNMLEVVGEDPILQSAELHVRGGCIPSLLSLLGVKSTFLRCVKVSTLLYQPLHKYSFLYLNLILTCSNILKMLHESLF